MSTGWWAGAENHTEALCVWSWILSSLSWLISFYYLSRPYFAYLLARLFPKHNVAGVSLYWWRGDKEWKQEKSGRWGGNHVTWEDEYKLPSSYKIGSTGVRKVCSLPSPCLTDTITATSNSTSTTFHHSSFWAISPIIRSLTLAPEDRKKALGNNLGWFRNILWRYAVY